MEIVQSIVKSIVGRIVPRYIATFDGTTSKIALGSDLTLASDFKITLQEKLISNAANQVLIGDVADAAWIRLNSNGSLQIKPFGTSTTGLYTFDGAGHTHEIERISTNVTWKIDGVLKHTFGTAGASIDFNRIGVRGAVFYAKGQIWDVNLNDQHYYLIDDNSTVIKDSIGSNNGTATNITWNYED